MKLSYEDIASIIVRTELLKSHAGSLAARSSIASVSGNIQVTSDHIFKAAAELDKRENAIFEAGAEQVKSKAARDKIASTAKGSIPS